METILIIYFIIAGVTLFIIFLFATDITASDLLPEEIEGFWSAVWYSLLWPIIAIKELIKLIWKLTKSL